MSAPTKLYSVTTEVIVGLTTLVRAESAEEAERLARERKVETSWHTNADGEGCLTHWTLGNVPGYAPKSNVVKVRAV